MSYSSEDIPNFDGERVDGPGPGNPATYDGYQHPYDGLSIYLPDGSIRRINVPYLPDPNGETK